MRVVCCASTQLYSLNDTVTSKLRKRARKVQIWATCLRACLTRSLAKRCEYASHVAASFDLPACLPTCLPACLPTCLPACCSKNVHMPLKNAVRGCIPVASRGWAASAAAGCACAQVLMLGLDAAGKTTILYKLHLGVTVKTIATIGVCSVVPSSWGAQEHVPAALQPLLSVLFLFLCLFCSRKRSYVDYRYFQLLWFLERALEFWCIICSPLLSAAHF